MSVKNWASIIGYIAMGRILVGLEWVERKLIKIIARCEEKENEKATADAQREMSQSQVELRNRL